MRRNNKSDSAVAPGTRALRTGVADRLSDLPPLDTHDAWFRTQVLAALEDSEPLISDAEAKRRFATKRAALRNAIERKHRGFACSLPDSSN